MIFVVGNSRSGTTMLGRVLGLHGEVHTFGELHFLEQLVGTEAFAANRPWPRQTAQRIVERLLTRARDGFFAPFSAGRYQSDARSILAQAPSLGPRDLYAVFLRSEAQRAGRRIPCEQTPRYLFSARELLRAYPEARVINMIRDPRDVLVSQRSKWKRRFLGGRSIPMREAIRAWCNYHPWLVSRLWVSCAEYAASIEEARFISIRFEDLLCHPEREVRRLCNFIGIAFENDMLNAPQVGSSTGRDAPDKTGLNTDRVGGWRKSGISDGARLTCEWVCHDRMRASGYGDFLNGGRFSPRVLFSMLALPGKLALAFGFNVTRFPHLFASLKRRLVMRSETA